MSGRHYFDWAATAIQESFDTESAFGNPSSLHREGRQAREALEKARSLCAEILGVAPKNLFFTSGGTESNAIVLFSTLNRPGSGAICYSAVEHASVRENCLTLERLGRQVWALPVESDGRVTAARVGKALAKHGPPRMAAVMAVNNETGVANDMAEVSAAFRAAGAPVWLHVDMVQAAGKIPLDITGWDIDSAAFSAHKLGGPRGIGLLYLKKPLEPLAAGHQEGGIRPGTENTAGAAALAAAMDRHARRETVEAASVDARRRFKRLIEGILATGRCRLVPADRLCDDPRFSPWILQAAFDGVPGEVMARALDELGVAVSTGSACSSSSPERPVLAAMDLDAKTRLEGIRISQGWSTTDDDVEALIGAVNEVLAFL